MPLTCFCHTYSSPKHTNLVMFKLSATLEAHDQDVRALVSPFNDTIVSASRDCTVKVWTLDNGVWSPRLNFTSTGFVNSLAFDAKDQLVISGGQDKLVNITDLHSSGIDAKFVLIGHESNVCCLDAKNDEIISGSWDSTAKVWQDNVLRFNLVGHNASVWDVKILGDNRYLTSSADGTIKIWDHDKAIKTIVGHKDVVRGLALLPGRDTFASTSNDGTIRITNFDGDLIQELVGHDSFVYGVEALSNGDIVSCGEDRTVRIWRDGKAIQVITLPSVSVWAVSVLPNDDIVSGGSDSVIRVFSRDPSRYASDLELEEFRKSVESISINTQELDESQIKSSDVLSSPGSKEGQVIVVKSEVGINEAYQWTEGKWSKIGEVVGGSASDKKKEYNGAKWDYIFDVDVKEGEPPLKLPYNLTENPYQAAERFLSQNELPSSYVEEIVKFITDNTQGLSINQSTANPYADTQNKSVIPQLDYLGFTNDNSANIFKGIKKLNETEAKQFTERELVDIQSYLEKKSIDKLLEIAEIILAHWENKLPSFDLLRLIISRLDKPPKQLGEFLKVGLDKSSPAIYFMTLRFLTNIFLNRTWGESIITDSSISTKILNLIETSTSGIEAKHQVNVSNATATLILNFSIYVVKFKSLILMHKLLEVLNKNGFEIGKHSSEAAYRLVVSYGNLNYVSPEVKYSPEFNAFKERTSSTFPEQRFKDVFSEIA